MTPHPTESDTGFVPDHLQDRLAVLPSAVPVDICLRILEVCNAMPQGPGPLYSHRTGQRYFDSETRLTSVAWHHQRDWLFELMEDLAARVNRAWDFILTDADPLQFAIYRRNDFFEWHQDMLRIRNENIRKLSVVLQLDAPDAYRGGRLEFLDNDRGPFVPDAFAARGSVAVFSTLLKHRVTPIKEGERRSLTGWFKGPPFR